jgi:hypothetical protein
MKETAVSNLQSILLYGSAARGNFKEGHSDLNLLCVFGSLTVEELGRAAPVVKWWCIEQKEPVPLFFTAQELHAAADVFSIEILDIQASHRVLYGADAVREIEVPMNLHRVQVEHDLRTTVLKLRGHYLRAPGNAEALAPVLRKSFSGVLILLRHTLVAFGEEPPSEAREVIARVTALAGLAAAAFDATLELHESGKLGGEINEIYGAYLKALEEVIQALGRHMPKREWRRVKNANS